MIELKACKSFHRNPILLTKRLKENKPMVIVELDEKESTGFSCSTEKDLKEVERFLKNKGIRKGIDFESGVLPRLQENDPITAYGFYTFPVSQDVLEELREYYYVALWLDHWKWIIG